MSYLGGSIAVSTQLLLEREKLTIQGLLNARKTNNLTRDLVRMQEPNLLRLNWFRSFTYATVIEVTGSYSPGPVHTTPEEFENRGFALKTHQMFSVHTAPEEFKSGGLTLKTHQMFSVRFSDYVWDLLKRKNHWSFWICVCGKLCQGSHMIIVTSSFSKISVFKMCSVDRHENKSGVLIPLVWSALSKSFVSVTD